MIFSQFEKGRWIAGDCIDRQMPTQTGPSRLSKPAIGDIILQTGQAKPCPMTHEPERGAVFPQWSEPGGAKVGIMEAWSWLTDSRTKNAGASANLCFQQWSHLVYTDGSGDVLGNGHTWSINPAQFKFRQRVTAIWKHEESWGQTHNKKGLGC